MRARLFVLLLPLLVATTLPAFAAPDPNPAVDQWVEADLTLRIDPLQELDVTGVLAIRQFVLGGDVYSAKDLAQSYSGASKFGKATGNAFVRQIEDGVSAQLAQILADAFPDAVSRTIRTVDVDESSLTATRVDDFDPPVRVLVEARVVRSLERMGLGSYGSSALNAVFDVGARVSLDLTLSASPGYKLEYNFAPPSGFAFSDVVGANPLGPFLVKLTIDNAAGNTPITAPVKMKLGKTGISVPTAEDVKTSITIEMGSADAALGGLPVDANVVAQIRAIDTARRLSGLLPDTVSIPYLSADALRTLRAGGALDDAALASADKALLDALGDELTTALGATVEPTGGLWREHLAAAPGSGPVEFRAKADALYALPEGAAENVDLALDIGASIRFELPLSPSSAETTYTVVAPPGVEFTEAAGATFSQDRRSATFTLRDGDAAAPMAFAVHQQGAPVFSEARATLGVLVDLKDLDVTLGGVTKGDFGDLVVDVNVGGDVHVLAVPDGLASSLGGLDLAYLASDSIRLLVQRGLITDAQLSELEAALLARVADGLSSSLGAAVEVTGGFEDATLAAEHVQQPVSDEVPVRFVARASFRAPLSGGGDVGNGAAIALYSQTQTFTLPRIEGLDTTYTVILPRGLDVTDVKMSGGQADKGTSADGRSQFTAKPDGDSAQAVVTMAVTPTFVMVKFWPIVLGAILVLVLIVGTPIALVVLRKRK